MRELRRTGKKEAAEALRALRKPSISAWAVNQAVRNRPQEAKALVKAGAELRKAQRGAISGRDPDALRAATRAHRDLVEELTETAREVLSSRGSVAPSVLLRVAQTLRSASVEKESSKALLAGALAEDVEQTGFGPLLSAVPTRSRAGPKTRTKALPRVKPDPKLRPDPKTEEAKALRRELTEAQKRARQERREADQAARRAEKAEHRVRAIEDKLDRLRTPAEE